jgi:hypothetical protein
MPPIASSPDWSVSSQGDKALVGNTAFRRYLKTISDENFAIGPDKVEEEKKFDGVRAVPTPISTRSKPCSATSNCGQWSKPSEPPSTCSRPGRFSSCSTRPFGKRVLQLSRAGVQEGAGRSHWGARSLRFLAADHRRSRLADGDRNRARQQTFVRYASRSAASLACARPASHCRRPCARPRPADPTRSENVVPSRVAAWIAIAD